MGTELMRISVKKESDEIPSVPPGFESFAAFSLRRVQDDENQESTNASSSSSPTSASESQTIQMETEFDNCSVAKVSKPLRHRPLINYEQLDNRPEEASDTLKRDQNLPLKPHLPKGVIRGCPECSNCQKVNARWSPEYACRPDLEDAPVFYPTEEDFEDTLTYIGRIRPKAEPYGICRIVPPPSWKPPFCLREKTIWESSAFATRVQRVDKLQNRVSMRKMSKTSSHNRKKRRRCMGMAVDCGTESGSNAALSEAGTFGFDAGPEFTLNTFQNYADYFKAQYFRKNDSTSDDGNTTIVLPENWEPTVENIEGEYWRIIEKATEEIEVLYGADLETGVFGSGFPKKSSEVSSGENEWYAKSGWNLNNFPRLPGSLLSYESGDISGVLVPWLYIGMCFSSFCWHVEDHHLYSLNYMHWGAPKMWYGVPGKDAIKFEDAMRKYLPDLFEEQPDLLHKLVTQLSPSILKSEGVPVYRCVQNSGEFVLTFPRAYHAGFNCGFNCAEAVNVAPVDWLPHGQTAIELYRDQGRRTSISHDKLLLGAAREAVRANWEVNLLKKNTSDNLRWKSVCGKDGILAKALKMRVEMERDRREFLCNSSQALKMDSNFDATSERECSVCLFDLHLSAAGCGCSPDKYTCLNHAKQLCSCSWGPKFFLFRYDTSELNILVEALEGKLSAVYRWARMDLGLALTSYVSQRNILDSKFSDSPKRTAIEEVKAHPPANALKDFLGKVVAGDLVFTSTGFFGDTTLEERKKLLEAATLKEMVTSSASHTSKVIKKEILDLTIDKEEYMEASTSVCQLSQEDTSYALNLTSDQYEGKKSSTLGHDTVILLSDDEGDELQKPLLERATENTLAKREITCGLAAKRCYSDNTTSNLTIIIPAVSGYQCTIKNSTLKHSGFSDGQSSSCSDSCKDGEHPVLTAPIPAIDAEPFGVKNVCLSPDEKNIDCTSDVVLIREMINEQSSTSSFPDRDSNTSLAHPVPVKEECIGAVLGSCPLSNSGLAGCTNVGSARNLQDSSNMRTTFKGQSMLNTENQQTWSCGIGNLNNVGKMGANAPAVSVDNSRVMAGSSSCSQNNLDRYFRQKGPRIAKVVRRINCHVEPLEFGVVRSGKLWCNSQAIFPKGFRSRVKYISVLDPTSMCYYVSEILEAGQNGPVFMVSLEDCPSEVFIHISAARCWEMVRERVNQEISRQHKLGKMNLPPLQPPGSLDGLEMFGFSSPAIVQAVEALDRKRICTDYWDSRPYSRPQGQIPLHSQYGEIRGGSFQGTHGEQSKNHLLPNGLDITLRGLFKKANQEELCSLSRILSDDSISDQGLIKLINEEIHSRPR